MARAPLIAILLAGLLAGACSGSTAAPEGRTARVGGDWTRFGYDAARRNVGPASTGITGPRVEDPNRERLPSEPDARDGDTRPKGTPTHERHATETAHQWEHEHHPRRRLRHDLLDERCRA